MQGETKFIYTSPRAFDKQGNKMTWVLPVPEDNPDFMSIKLNENNTFTLTVDREMLNVNNTGKNDVIVLVSDKYYSEPTKVNITLLTSF